MERLLPRPFLVPGEREGAEAEAPGRVGQVMGKGQGCWSCKVPNGTCWCDQHWKLFNTA